LACKCAVERQKSVESAPTLGMNDYDPSIMI